MKSIGAKYSDPVALQGRVILPRGGGGPGAPGAAPIPPYRAPNAIKVTVTPSSGDAVTGTLVRVTDFEVTLFDPKTDRMRSWLRNGDVPKVVVTDPLQGHVDLLTKWTDADMHNVTAYLAGLK